MKTGRLILSLFVFCFLTVPTVFGQGSAPWEYWRNTQVPITDLSTATSAITVPDVFTIANMAVMVDIRHTSARDLLITLTGPTGSYILSQYNGSVYDNYENTLFDASAGIPGYAINAGSNVSAYFRGVYRPQNTLPTSGSATGTWTLSVYDNAVGDQGVLRKWGLIFNRYGQYKDFRIGADINYWHSFYSLGSRYPAPFIGDVTPLTIGLRPLTVYGHRLQSNVMLVRAIVQNSKTASNVAMNTYVTDQMGMMSIPFQDIPLSVSANTSGWVGLYFSIPGSPGNWTVRGDTYLRSDLFMSRDDNAASITVPVTPGTLALDSGPAMGTMNLPVNDCEAVVFDITQQQILTSIDVWQGSSVELEPPASAARVSARIYSAPSGIPTGQVATTGVRSYPKQGSKWVTYAFNPPVTLPAGTYGFAFCADVAATTGGTGLGVDQLGSPFDIDGVTSRYAPHAVEFYSLNNGSSWSNETIRIFGGKKIRPNFVLGADVGVVSIDAPAGPTIPSSFTPMVTFGSFAHHPSLPNLVAIAKLYVINNATKQTVAYSEKRIFLQNNPFTYQLTFDPVSGLSSGSYTIRVDIDRADDENLANNTYSRTYTVPFAPIIVSYSGRMTEELKNDVIKNFAELGQQVEFVDRSMGGFTLPDAGHVVWVGDLSKEDAVSAREFVENGNFFAVLPSADMKGDVVTQVYDAISTPREAETLARVIAESKNPPFIRFDRMIENTLPSFVFAKSGDSMSDLEALNAHADASLRTRLAEAAKLPVQPRSASIVTFNQSEEVNVEAQRLGSLSLVQVFVNKAEAPRPIVNPIVNPNGFELTQNYPNPFNPTTNIAYNVVADAQVNLRVYDVLGREVALLVNMTQNAGKYVATWDGRNSNNELVSSGLYLYRMEAQPVDGSAPFVTTRKMVFSK